MDQIEQHYITQFHSAWEHLTQQMSQLFAGVVSRDTVNGKEKSYNQIAKTTMRLVTTRSGQTIPQERDLTKRWVRPRAYDAVDWFDEFDDILLGTIVKPTSEVIQSHVAAYKRTLDALVLNAAVGTAYTGESGTTGTVLPTTQKVAVNYIKPGGTPANVGLTLDKLIKAKSILGKNHVYEDQNAEGLVISVKQAHLDDLLFNVSQVSSKDYNAVQALVNGEVKNFMGFRFIRSEENPWVDEANDVSAAVVWHPSAIKLVEGTRKTHMDVLPQQNHTLQIRTVGWMGATRMMEEKVVQIACDESP